MPTFNRPEFISGALESVYAQTFQDWELLIADDGSDANTRTQLESVVDPPRIRALWLNHSGKPGVARNAAIREAHGTYVAFLDSDDLWLPRKLEMQVSAFRQNPTCSWSYTRFAQIDECGNRRSPEDSKSWPAPSGWILKKLLKEETVVALPSVMVSRCLLEEVGGFDDTFVMSEDDDLWLRLAARSEIAGVNEALTLIRRHSQHSGSDSTAWRDRRRVFEKALLTGTDDDSESDLRRLRADMAVGLALSQIKSRECVAALGTVASSGFYSWRYSRWWRGALVVLGGVFVPAALRWMLARYRAARNLRAGTQAS